VIVETINLDSGLVIELDDQTSHYFGGYFHVRIQVRCAVELKQEYFASAEEYVAAAGLMGNAALFERSLEKMAVPEAEVGAVRDQLISAFRENANSYMASPDFAARFLKSEFVKRTKKPLRTQRFLHG
jgi:hypothetical protein